MNNNTNLQAVLSSQLFPGIGPTIATNLISHFGATCLLETLNNMDAAALTHVKRVNGVTASTLIAGASFAPGLLNLALILDNLGLKKPYAKRLYDVWGAKSIDVIHDNPYVLLAVLNWQEVDPIGLKLGNPHHPCRVVAAIEWCMYRDYEQYKHTAIDRETLCKAVYNLINCSSSTFSRGLCIALRTQSIVKHLEMFQLPVVNHYERHLEIFLANNDKSRLHESDINHWLDNSSHINLTHEQRTAVKNAIIFKTSAYYGRGGRGKTWTLQAIVEGAKLLLHKKRVILSAIAAKAVRRMQLETNHSHTDCRTITSLIYQENKETLKNSFIIIDEASMLSLVDAFRLINKIPSSTHLVLLGDHNQIPSILAGRFFWDIIKNNAVPNIELTISHRHDKKTDIQLQEVLAGKFPLFEEYTPECKSGLYRHITDNSKIEDFAIELYINFTIRKKSVQIISPLRNINYRGSSDAINQKAHNAIFKTKGAHSFCAGTPVVWTKNTTVHEGATLANGSIGYVHEISRNDSEYYLSVAFEYEGVVLLTHYEMKEYLDFAYCLSVHQAQGSEWDNVIVVIPRSERMIDRNMIYTALSRCKTRSIAIYSDHTFVVRKLEEPPAHRKRRSIFLKGLGS